MPVQRLFFSSVIVLVFLVVCFFKNQIGMFYVREVFFFFKTQDWTVCLFGSCRPVPFCSFWFSLFVFLLLSLARNKNKTGHGGTDNCFNPLFSVCAVVFKNSVSKVGVGFKNALFAENAQKVVWAKYDSRKITTKCQKSWPNFWVLFFCFWKSSTRKGEKATNRGRDIDSKKTAFDSTTHIYIYVYIYTYKVLPR